MQNHIRLFVATPLPETLKQQLLSNCRPFEHEGVRIVPEANLHLTLFFIGNIDPAKVPAIETALAKVAAGTAPFELKLEVIEPGPKPKHPRLIWARFRPDPDFAELSYHITHLLSEHPNPPLKPIPHITLARFKKDKPISNLPVVHPQELLKLEVNEIALWQSKLGQPHPTYSIISRFPLTAE